MLVLLRQHPFVAVAALIVVLLLIWGFWPQPVLVEAASAKRAPMTVTIDE
jgi:HlyD family secretion protein